MPRYIDAEELKHKLNMSQYYGKKAAMDFCDMMTECDATDIVEIVRCRDCEYWDPGSPMATVIPTPCRCRVRREDYGMTAEDFCSYGRRKEKNDD